MTDIKKVIKGLECCSDLCCAICESDIPERNHDCLYFNKDYKYFESCDMSQLMMDALALLKEKSPVKPITESDHDSPCGTQWYVCPGCRIAIDYLDKYCRHCGRPMLWE